MNIYIHVFSFQGMKLDPVETKEKGTEETTTTSYFCSDTICRPLYIMCLRIHNTALVN